MKIGYTKEMVWDEWVRIYELESDGVYFQGLDVFDKYGKRREEGINSFLAKQNIGILYKLYKELSKIK